MRTSTLVIASLATLAAAACGSDAPGTGPVSAADAQDGCRASCEHDQACNPQSTTTVEACTARCVSDVSTGWFRADAFAALIDCMTALACTANDNTCIAECTPTSTHELWETQCRKVFAGCGSADQVNGMCETTPAPSGDTGIFCLITPSIMNEMIACIPDGVGCEEGITCVQGVLEAHNIDL